jgi:hypothetical protein
LDYEEFQSQALGVGAAIYAVTGLFWVAVLLLVSHDARAAVQACLHVGTSCWDGLESQAGIALSAVMHEKPEQEAVSWLPQFQLSN